jgi:hypothetical protein
MAYSRFIYTREPAPIAVRGSENASRDSPEPAVIDCRPTIEVWFVNSTMAATATMSFKFDGAEKKQAVSIMYFRPGIRWIPTYRVSLNDRKDKKTAAVSLQAELLNEAEDLTDVPVDIVVGVPNFRFRGTPSPLVLEATLRNALAEAAPDLMGNAGNSLSNAMYS